MNTVCSAGKSVSKASSATFSSVLPNKHSSNTSFTWVSADDCESAMILRIKNYAPKFSNHKICGYTKTDNRTISF